MPSLFFQLFQTEDFRFQFLHGAGGGGLVGYSFLKGFVIICAHRFSRVPDVIQGLAGGGQVIGQGAHHLPALFQFFFFNTSRQFLATPLQRLVNGFWAGGQAALQRSEGESDGALARTVQVFRPVHFFFDVIRNCFIKRSFYIREFIGCCFGNTFRK